MSLCDVIIPASGDTPWINESLVSIANQSLIPNHVFIVDDGLTHHIEVAEIGKKLMGNRFVIMKNDGKGISCALNYAIGKSNAKYIARMDADDVAHEVRLEEQINYLESSPEELIGCGTQVRYINEDGRILSRSDLPCEWGDIVKEIYKRSIFCHPTLVFRRSAVAKLKYRHEIDGAEDLDLILRLAEVGKITNIKKILLDYRLHTSQVSFHRRAIQTALQELAFRVALTRREKNFDPLDKEPNLSRFFVSWRTSDNDYVRTRISLTYLRYALIFMKGGDLRRSLALINDAVKQLPLNLKSLVLIYLIIANGGAALVKEKSPFPTLNV